MKKISLFVIYRKEIVWSTEYEEEATFTELGSVKDEETANNIVYKLNNENKKIEFSYGYNQKVYSIFNSEKEFLTENYGMGITLE